MKLGTLEGCKLQCCLAYSGNSVSFKFWYEIVLYAAIWKHLILNSISRNNSDLFKFCYSTTLQHHYLTTLLNRQSNHLYMNFVDSCFELAYIYILNLFQLSWFTCFCLCFESSCLFFCFDFHTIILPIGFYETVR